MDKAAKEAKAAKRAQKKAAAGGGASAGASGSSKASRSKPKAKPEVITPTKGGSGSNFKSKEFIDDSDSSSGGELGAYRGPSLEC